MSKSDLDVKYVAHLARLELAPDEEAHYGAQLLKVLDYINQLRRLNVDGVEPTAHALSLQNVTRPDETRPSLSREEALRNAPAQADGLFVVPKIVE